MNYSKVTSTYALAKTFTPVLNTENFLEVFGGDDGKSLSLDDQNLLRAMEFIAFPQTKFTILSIRKNHILEVSTLEYPYRGSFFVDSRFLTPAVANTSERQIIMPSQENILEILFALSGTRYFWGGNTLGVEELLSLYPPKESLEIENSTLKDWTLAGMDCSGLMYYATNGFTPRNTSSWLNFGSPIHIKEQSIETILSLLKPLDAIVWKGHILFVYDAFQTIESKNGKGVILTDIKQRLTSLILEENRSPQNIWQDGMSQFLIRRWIQN